jgi:uncharacterized protein YkwD
MPLPLQKINSLRAKHRVQSLVQDGELTKSAQQWADWLVRNNQFKHSGQQGKGENLAWCSSAEQAVDMWYNEVGAFDWGNPRFTGATGHFTALVWKATTRIGWGEARRPDGAWIYVAQFTPPGNVTGQFQGNVLKA